MPKLTKRLVEATKPEKTDVILRDSETKGFLCKITPKGNRVYMLYYRTREGRERKPAIGEHGKITCEQARDTAKQWLAEVHEGGDPSLAKQQSREIPSLAEFSQKYMAASFAQKKPSSREMDARLWRLHINPVLGKHAVTSITKADIANLRNSMSDTPANANRVLALLKTAFRWGVEESGYKIKENPATPVKKYKEEGRERYLNAVELACLGDALKCCEAEDTEAASALLAIRLLIMTGCRRNEILELQWKWIDFEQGVINYPDSKTGKKSILLNPPALALLSNAPRIAGNPHVCVGMGKTGHLINIQKPWRRIIRRAEALRLIDLIAGHEGWSNQKIEYARRAVSENPTEAFSHYQNMVMELGIHTGNTLATLRIHDLRHSFASVGAAGGISLLMIGKLLGHKEQSTTARYSHLADDPLKEATNIIGNRIWAAMEGKQAEVIPIKRQQD